MHDDDALVKAETVRKPAAALLGEPSRPKGRYPLKSWRPEAADGGSGPGAAEPQVQAKKAVAQGEAHAKGQGKDGAGR